MTTNHSAIAYAASELARRRAEMEALLYALEQISAPMIDGLAHDENMSAEKQQQILERALHADNLVGATRRLLEEFGSEFEEFAAELHRNEQDAAVP